jgi:hypothetical protein
MRYVSLFSLSAIRGQNGSRLSSIDVGADYCRVVAGGFEGQHRRAYEVPDGCTAWDGSEIR